MNRVKPVSWTVDTILGTMKPFLFTVFVTLSLVAFAGAVLGLSGPLGDSRILGVGVGFLLLHAALNPDCVVRPNQANSLAKGRCRSVGAIGLILIVVGLIEVSGILSIEGRMPLMAVLIK